jgi:hypothetical protein
MFDCYREIITADFEFCGGAGGRPVPLWAHEQTYALQ